MKLVLLRHAKAGSRSSFDGNDIDRPITASGRRQAELLCEVEELKDGTYLVSSPYTRCIQTLEPLSNLLSVDIELDRRLVEGSESIKMEQWLSDMSERSDTVIACSHGDVIPHLVELIAARSGIEWFSLLCAKGSFWCAELDGAVATSLLYVDPGSIYQRYRPGLPKDVE